MNCGGIESSDAKVREGPPNLYLAGFMGTGKSAVGRRVAADLGMRFVDSDQVIQALAEMRIPEIFERFGEARFREMERDFVLEGHPGSGMVVSCGGGLITQEGLLEILITRGVVVALFASVETILGRVSGDRNRPLLQVPDPRKRIEELLEARASAYRAVGNSVNTDGRTISQVAEHVKRVYLESARNF